MNFILQAFTKITAMPLLWLFFKSRVYCETPEAKHRYAYIRGNTILMANHQSMWDPIFMGTLFCFREIRIWAGEVLYQKHRLFTWFLNHMGFIKVNRAIADLNAIQQAVNVLDQGGLMGIFPEGRLNHQPGLLPFRPGIVMVALKSRTPIVPIYFDGSYGLFRRAGVMVGEKIYLHEHPLAQDPYPEAIEQLCAYLAERVAGLREAYEERERERGRCSFLFRKKRTKRKR